MNWEEFYIRVGKTIPKKIATSIENYLSDVLVSTQDRPPKETKELEYILLDALITAVDYRYYYPSHLGRKGSPAIYSWTKNVSSEIAHNIKIYVNGMVRDGYYPHEIMALGELVEAWDIKVASDNVLGETGYRDSKSVLMANTIINLPRHLNDQIREIDDLARFVSGLGKIRKN